MLVILGGVGKVPPACYFLRLGTSSVSFVEVQYSRVWKSGDTSLPRLSLASRTLQGY